MVKTIAKVLGIAVIALVITGGALYAFGLRVVLDGGGGVHLQFVESAEERAAAVARHREAQGATGGPVVPAPAPPPAVATPGVSPEAAAPDPITVDSAKSGAAYWTDFRGPNRDGHYQERPILTAWPSVGLKPMWKQPIGGGYASFVVARGRAFTIEQRGPQEVASAYDVATGRELWTSTWSGAFREMMGGDGPRATPTWSDGRVYVLGGNGEFRCLDEAAGTVIWRTNILEDAGAENLQWGMSAAPLIVDETVVVLPGGPNGKSVVAYDRRTGKRAWSALDDRQAYASPMLVTLGGVRQIVVFAATRVMGITPDRGELLWAHPWKTSYDVNASQPLVIGDNRVFLSSGYGTGATVLELTRAGQGFTVTEVWRNIRMKNQFTSSVLHEGHIYGLDEAILASLDAATGVVNWKGGRYGYGQIMLASGHLIVVTEEGELALVRATPERHVEIARFPVLDGKTWNHPVIAGGILLVRNINEMAAFDLRGPDPISARPYP
jgi:outer membrane protein assembly factor BamB